MSVDLESFRKDQIVPCRVLAKAMRLREWKKLDLERWKASIVSRTDLGVND